MKTGLVVVSIVAILAVGGLAFVLATGWTIDEDTEAVTDSQATWCMSNVDLVVVAASNLHMHSTTVSRNWAAFLRIVDLAGGLSTVFDGAEVGQLHNMVVVEFEDWLRELGVGASILGNNQGVSWTKPMSEDPRVQRACLAAWGAEFGQP